MIFQSSYRSAACTDVSNTLDVDRPFFIIIGSMLWRISCRGKSIETSLPGTAPTVPARYSADSPCQVQRRQSLPGTAPTVSLCFSLGYCLFSTVVLEELLKNSWRILKKYSITLFEEIMGGEIETYQRKRATLDSIVCYLPRVLSCAGHGFPLVVTIRFGTV